MLRSRAPSTRPAPGPVSIRRFGRLTGSAHVPRFRLISGLESRASRQWADSYEAIAARIGFSRRTVRRYMPALV